MSTARFRESSKLGAEKYADAMRDIVVEASLTHEQRTFVNHLKELLRHRVHCLQWLVLLRPAVPVVLPR
jgi:hypothetical protein